MSRCIEWIGRGLAAAALWATNASAFDFITDESSIYVVTWPRGPVPMVNHLDDTAVLSDGTTEHGSAEVALARWNELLGNMQFSSTSGPVGAFQSGNGQNELVRASEIDVYTFGASTLAVTLSYRDGNDRTESDVIFNDAFTWDSYRGTLRSGLTDLRRVALHELGHVIGLDHPDQASPRQTVTALMNSTVSNVDALQADDIAGGQFLYGAPDSPPANDDFAAAVVVTLDSAGQASVTGTTVQAGSEAGEPLLDPDYPSGRSSWWTWTAPANGLLHVTTLGSRFDTFLGAFTGGQVDALTLIGSNDDVDPGIIRTSTLTFRVAVGTAYHFLVDGWNGYEGGVQLNLSLLADAGPTVTVPAPRVVGERGQALTLTVEATAELGGVLSYQWRRDNWVIEGATAAELTLPSFRNSDAGVYAVTVSEAGGGTNTGLVYVLPDHDATELVTWGGDAADGKRQVPEFTAPVLQVELGGAHGLALQRDGTVVGWGSPTGLEAQGQEVPPEGLADVVAIAAGERHSLALKADGTVVAWGSNDYEQSLVPWDLADVVAIGAGAYYSVALRADGEVVAWGYGVEPGGEMAVPEEVVNAVAISGGAHWVLAELADGSLQAWGDPNDGKLTVPDLGAVADFSAGTSHALVAGTDGLVVGWGSNDFGETTIPAGLQSVTAVAAGLDFSVALRDDHTVVAWGTDAAGETAVPDGLDRVVQLETGRTVGVALRDLSAPVIVGPAADATVVYGNEATLTVEALGAGLDYQWYAGESGDTTAPVDGATAATIVVAPAVTTSYWVRVSDGASAVDGGAVTVTVTPVAPVITAPPTAVAYLETVTASLQVEADGSPPLAYQWWHDGVELSGATNPTLPLAGLLALTGEYTVTVSNDQGSVMTDPVWVAVFPTGESERAAQAAEQSLGDGALANDTWRLTGRTEWRDAADVVSWQVLLPDGWAVGGEVSAVPAANVVPVAGDTGVAEWQWTDGPVVTATVGVRIAAAEPFAGVVALSSLVTITRPGGAAQVLAEPEPLVLRSSRHSADSDGDRRIGLLELLRVIELYNTRAGTERTGAYDVLPGTEDGFAAAADGASPAGEFAGFHSADTDRNHRLGLTELLRMIELYNTRAGTERTGAYRIEEGTEDGFTPDL